MSETREGPPPIIEAYFTDSTTIVCDGKLYKLVEPCPDCGGSGFTHMDTDERCTCKDGWVLK